MAKRVHGLVAWLAVTVVLVALGCGDDKSAGGAGAPGPSVAGGMAVTGTSGTAGVGAAGMAAGAAGTGRSTGAAGTGAAGRAAAGAGAAGMGTGGAGAAGMGAAGMGMSAAGAGAAGMGSGTSGAGGALAGTGGAAGGGSGGAFTLTSSAVENGKMLPVKHRCESPDNLGGPTGPNPPFAWTGAPEGTMSFALIMRDRTFNNYQHWTIYDIPATTTSLPEGVPTGAMPTMPTGAKQASNAAGLAGPGYYGPCGRGVNNYEFKLYALDVATLPMPGTAGTSVEMALEMHDLGTASLMVMSGPQ